MKAKKTYAKPEIESERLNREGRRCASTYIRTGKWPAIAGSFQSFWHGSGIAHPAMKR